MRTITEAQRLQASIHGLLDRLVNAKVTSPAALAQYLIAPSSCFRKRALAVYGAFRQWPANPDTRFDTHEVMDLQPYNGNNQFAERMKRQLYAIGEHLVQATVHGSLAMRDEVNYSDFDGLVILKNNVLENPRLLAQVAAHLDASRKIMLEMDPLQHHGWLVLAEFELDHFDEGFLPVELLRQSRSLFPDRESKLLIRRGPVPDFKGLFLDFSDRLIGVLQNAHRIRNMFVLKSVLSRFMLLPAMFHQALTGNPIAKQDSFAAVRPSFSWSEWEPMDNVSLIRAGWMPASAIRHRRTLARFYFLHPRLLYPLYPAISSTVRRQCAGLFPEMIIFATRMQAKLK